MKIEKAIYLNSFNFHKVGKENRSFSRIYFGNEFCENLTPEVNELKNIFKIIEKKSINFSFVTPWSTDRGIKKLEKIFDFLPAGKSDFIRDVFPKMLENDLGLYGYETSELIGDVGTPERFKKMEEVLSK